MKQEIERIGWMAGAVVFLACLVSLCSCQRVDKQDEYYKDGLLVSLHYASITGWATDSNSDKIVADPNGLITITGYGKQEDSLNVEVDPVQRKLKLTTSPKGK